ncbi:glycosyltransferase [Waterburya agarophytonicola K14]|uniref:Glycosyltransferase n=1 Tax=Waterburya agarophytonicola KI4 TaxID=2874699 RepID=A0A964FGD6_9CYAN|nr:glycosyltransferase [Waterburya agarophytonicola]MCC0176428.1 glycosyltransferase [Waterburya agarophytonicola KI4]
MLAQNSPDSTWICCQIGAREHYAIPRALHQQGQLEYLITDTWIEPNSPLNRLPKPYLANLRERFHPELNNVLVYSFNQSLFQFELTQKLRQSRGWKKIIARNDWFQDRALKVLKKYPPKLNSKITIFAYSYAALKLFRYAKNRGWQTVLGQIDPGITEEQIVNQEHLKHPNYQSHWQPAPFEYWSDWKQECNLADKIIVNSAWSKNALQANTIAQDKIDIVPLAYQSPKVGQDFIRTYPRIFTHQRPLRVLFLGQIILRKGIADLIKAAEVLQDEPIEFWLVGSLGITQLENISPNIKLPGAVPRSVTAQYYQQADIFLFPTLSDGFGLTQLEAQAWQLPIIASENCGAVVKNKINGLILRELTPDAIANALRFCQQNPQQLQEFATQSYITSEFSLQNLSSRLKAITHGCT